MNKRHLRASVLLASALFLTACGSSGNDTASSPSSEGSTSAEADKGNAADITFLTGMKPHHEQAVEMSRMVLRSSPPAEVAVIAQQIEGAQAPEITQMNTLLADLGQKAPGGGMDHGSMSGKAGHEGMMSDVEMAALMKASGTDAARLYLEGMVRHHQGAIKASDAELKDGKYAPALELAQQIKQAQTAEITRMKALLDTL